MERALAIEDAYGRQRDGERWGPRTLDVDLIMVGSTEIDQEDLKLPHPLASERGFVLVPWYEIDPGAELPGTGKIADLVKNADTSGVVRRADLVIESD
jgi:2-amino-4-hydroxy-6-hydroxymethyldihydropteridine diphosphokinase